jgi:hypothetical protein
MPDEHGGEKSVKEIRKHNSATNKKEEWGQATCLFG